MSVRVRSLENELMQSPAPRSRVRSLVRMGAPLLLLVLLSGCLLPPEPKTEAGESVFNLYLITLALAAIVFIGVEGFILYAVFRYRRQPGDDVLPEQHHGNNLIEIIWTAIPTVIVLTLFTFSMLSLAEVEARVEGDQGVNIQVEGFQWSWRFVYEEPEVAITGTAAEPPELVVPVGEPVVLTLTALDVNHSFYVPDFLIKRDLIDFGPQREDNELRFTVDEVGTYAGQCAEFCGTAHADMTFTVNAMERADYDAYLADLAAGEEPEPATDTGECGTTVELAAVESVRFDTDRIEVPAGEAFCINFTNNDAVPHDVGIQETEYNGDDVAPGESITYVIDAMDAGEYTFYCTLHPTMAGDLIVTGE